MHECRKRWAPLSLTEKGIKWPTHTWSECCPLIPTWEVTLLAPTQCLCRDHPVSRSLQRGPWYSVCTPRSADSGLFRFSQFSASVKGLPSSWSATSFPSPRLHLPNPFKIYLHKSLPPFPTDYFFFHQVGVVFPPLIPCLFFDTDSWLMVTVHRDPWF